MSQPQWVKLHLAPQTYETDMPSYVVGLLISEVPGQYVLNPMLELEHDESTGKEAYVSAGMNLISKTYVWRCQILERKPEIDEIDDNPLYEDLGGGLD